MASNADEEKLDVLMGETIGAIILDSGCSRTVCGKYWFDAFKDTLSDEELATVTENLSSAVFRFGDGNKLRSLKSVTFPCMLAGRCIRIRTDVVDSKIPLLLSKASMKRAGMVIDLNSDTVTVFGKVISLNTTSLGHYILPIHRTSTPEFVNEILTASATESVERVAMKLHRQFAHPTPEKLKKLLKDAGKHDVKLHEAVDMVSASCAICRIYKRPVPRPVVSLSLSDTFNGTVAMDLKFLEGSIILVLVDLATRYCVATIIKDKMAETVIRSIFMCWITIFGAPSQILSDNGREFNNDEMLSLGDMFGIKILCTASYSPWSNGVCERLNAVLGTSVRRIMEDTHCDVRTAVAWAVAARNSLHNFSGYSPNQLVFGYNPSLPNVMSGAAPALEARTNSELIADNLNAMHSARKDLESNEKKRRALLSQVRADNLEGFCQGDSVYFKREDERWHGPATIIGRDGTQVLVRHGGEMYMVHTCQLQNADPHLPGKSSLVSVSPKEVEIQRNSLGANGTTTILTQQELNVEEDDYGDPPSPEGVGLGDKREEIDTLIY